MAAKVPGGTYSSLALSVLSFFINIITHHNIRSTTHPTQQPHTTTSILPPRETPNLQPQTAIPHRLGHFHTYSIPLFSRDTASTWRQPLPHRSCSRCSPEVSLTTTLLCTPAHQSVTALSSSTTSRRLDTSPHWRSVTPTPTAQHCPSTVRTRTVSFALHPIR